MVEQINVSIILLRIVVIHRRHRVNLQSRFVRLFQFFLSYLFSLFSFIYLCVAGNELDSFPVDVSFMSSIKKRISLAKQIDKEEHK